MNHYKEVQQNSKKDDFEIKKDFLLLRTCLHCEEKFYTSSFQFDEHVVKCKHEHKKYVTTSQAQRIKDQEEKCPEKERNCAKCNRRISHLSQFHRNAHIKSCKKDFSKLL
jgi:hypothetical protein